MAARKKSSSGFVGATIFVVTTVLTVVFVAMKWAVLGAIMFLRALFTSELSRSLRWRYRDYLPPIGIGIALELLDFIVNGYSVWYIAGGCLIVSAVTSIYLKGKLNRSVEWIYAGSCMAAVTIWLCTQASEPWSPSVGLFGVLAWSGSAIIWWLHHKVRPWEGIAKSNIVERWNTYIKSSDKAMKDAEISSPVPFKYGDSYTINLVPYKQTLAGTLADLENISSGLDTPVQNLLLEAHPDYPGRPTKVRLQVVTRSPIEHAVTFDTPRYEDGRILLGPFADGMGEASVRLYTESSMWGGFILGETGSGKTGVEDIIAVTALVMRDAGQPTVIFYMDGQNGSSSPTLFKHADWAVGVAGVEMMMAALGRIADYRQLDKRVNGWDFTPCSDRPGILVLVDEAHAVIEKCAKQFDKAVNEWRKLGMSIWVGDQGSDLRRTFAGMDTMRTALMAGNGVGLRVSSKVSPNLVTGFDTPLSKLPKLPGYGVITHDVNSGMRSAPFRCRHALTREYVRVLEEKGKPVPKVRTVEDWYEAYPSLGLDPGAARAAGADYANRHEQAEMDLERAREELRRMEGGLGPSEPPRGPDGGIPPLSGGSGPGSSQGEAEAASANRCSVRILNLTWDVDTDKTTATIQEELRADGGGPVSDRTITNALKTLTDKGALEKIAHGKYRLKISAKL